MTSSPSSTRAVSGRRSDSSCMSGIVTCADAPTACRARDSSSARDPRRRARGHPRRRGLRRNDAEAPQLERQRLPGQELAELPRRAAPDPRDERRSRAVGRDGRRAGRGAARGQADAPRPGGRPRSPRGGRPTARSPWSAASCAVVPLLALPRGDSSGRFRASSAARRSPESRCACSPSATSFRAELIALPLLLLFGIWVFRSAVAALLPVAAGVLSIATTLALLRFANGVAPISVFALNLVTGAGLGLAIDYSLLLVSRYREELERSGPGATAVHATIATAGRTIAFSALTVAVAFASLLVFPLAFLRSMAIGGLIVAPLAGLVALTVVPALFVLLGRRINALAIRLRARRPGRRLVPLRPLGDALAAAGRDRVVGAPDPARAAVPRRAFHRASRRRCCRRVRARDRRTTRSARTSARARPSRWRCSCRRLPTALALPRSRTWRASELAPASRRRALDVHARPARGRDERHDEDARPPPARASRVYRWTA